MPELFVPDMLSDNRLEAPYRLVTTSEEEFRALGAKALEETCKEIGFSFHSLPGIMQGIKEINNTQTFTRDDSRIY